MHGEQFAPLPDLPEQTGKEGFVTTDIPFLGRVALVPDSHASHIFPTRELFTTSGMQRHHEYQASLERALQTDVTDPRFLSDMPFFTMLNTRHKAAETLNTSGIHSIFQAGANEWLFIQNRDALPQQQRKPLDTRFVAVRGVSQGDSPHIVIPGVSNNEAGPLENLLGTLVEQIRRTPTVKFQELMRKRFDLYDHPEYTQEQQAIFNTVRGFIHEWNDQQARLQSSEQDNAYPHLPYVINGRHRPFPISIPQRPDAFILI